MGRGNLLTPIRNPQYAAYLLQQLSNKATKVDIQSKVANSGPTDNLTFWQLLAKPEAPLRELANDVMMLNGLRDSKFVTDPKDAIETVIILYHVKKPGPQNLEKEWRVADLFDAFVEGEHNRITFKTPGRCSSMKVSHPKTVKLWGPLGVSVPLLDIGLSLRVKLLNSVKKFFVASFVAYPLSPLLL